MHQPFKHQKISTKFFDEREKTLDFSDPGTGKTRAYLDTFAKRGGKALVVAPMTLMEAAWVDDAVKFTPDLVVLPAYVNFRDRLAYQKCDIFVVNTDAAKWLAKQPKKFFDQFDTLILDEIHKFKHRTSQRSKAIRSIVPKFRYVHGMSGTPASNAITDIWHPVYLVDQGKRLGTSFYKFRMATQFQERVGPGAHMVKWHDKPGAEQAVGSLIKDICVRHKFEDCIDIPPNAVHRLYFSLPPRLMRIYQDFKAEAILVLQDGVVNAVNAAVMRGKLLQIASGSVYDSSSEAQLLDKTRYELTAELVSQRQHSITFFQWAHQKEAIMKEYDKQGVSYKVIDKTTRKELRPNIIREFQQGIYQNLLMHPETGSHGITLTKATAVIWPSPTSNLDHWVQGYRRIVRAGQENKTETILITAKGTIEEKVYNVLLGKNEKHMTLLEMLE